MADFKVGYHCSHEQSPPSQLLRLVAKAEQAGFQAAMCSDHFAPWSEAQGQSGFAWSWLGAALQATELDFGMVSAPGQRYHPAILAQAAATLSEMFPQRLWCAFGSGQHLNEHITGTVWPSKAARNQRLKECVEVIRALWSGQSVTHHSEHLKVDEARLYSLPDKLPLLLAAAVTAETAEWVAGWADGVITIAKPLDQQKEFVRRFRAGGGGEKPMFLQAQVSYAESDQKALQLAHAQWKNNILDNSVLTELRSPEQFDAMGSHISVEQMEAAVWASADWRRHLAWLEESRELGFERIFVHNVNLQEDAFLDVYGEKVIPELGGR